jgi:S-adenosylmethionine hydrolase
MSFEPVIENGEDETTIIGKVIYLDRYENAIVNIKRDLFESTGKGRPFSISFNSFLNTITEISKSYGDVAISDMLALFDSNDFLEIAINQGNAGSLLGLKLDTKVRISFKG